MNLPTMPMEAFVEFIGDMPDIEAIDEIDSRLQRIVDDRQELGEATGKAERRHALNLEEDQLRLLRQKLVMRCEQRKWSKAVRAIFGQEGIDQCLEWMRDLPEAGVKQLPVRRDNVRRTHS